MNKKEILDLIDKIFGDKSVTSETTIDILARDGNARGTGEENMGHLL